MSHNSERSQISLAAPAERRRGITVSKRSDGTIKTEGFDSRSTLAVERQESKPSPPIPKDPKMTFKTKYQQLVTKWQIPVFSFIWGTANFFAFLEDGWPGYQRLSTAQAIHQITILYTFSMIAGTVATVLTVYAIKKTIQILGLRT